MVRRLLLFRWNHCMPAPSSSGCGRANQTLRLFIHHHLRVAGPLRGSGDNLYCMEKIVDIVFRTSFRILCDRVDSEEVTRSVLDSASRHSRTYDGSTSSMDWFLRQTCFLCRLRILRRRMLWLMDIRNDVFVRASPRVENQDDYITKQAWQLYCRAVFRMTPLQGMAYALCVLEEIPASRVASMLFISRFRVSLALERAVARVRRELATYGSNDMYHSFVGFIRRIREYSDFAL